MTTRRVSKKVLVRTAKEVLDTIELSLGKKVRNRSYLGRFFDSAFERKEFSIFPLVVDNLPSADCHLGFEPHQLRITLRGNNAETVRAVENTYNEDRSPHPHVQVRFVAMSHEEFKELLGLSPEAP